MSGIDTKAAAMPAVVAAEEEKRAKDRTRAYQVSAQYIEELTSKCDDVQAKVLVDILSQNVETEYLKRYGMSLGHIDRETFKTNVPVVTYEDIKADLLRIYNGDFSPILCAQPLAELLLSSGTSDGQRKMVPVTDDDMKRRIDLFVTVMPFLKQRIEGEEPDKGKAFTLLITKDETVTPGGLLARPLLNSIFKNPQYPNDKPYPYNINTSPIEAILCSDHYQSLYIQFLCGFYQRRDVTRVKAIFSSTLIWGIHFLKTHYSDLCHDISSGILNPKITNPKLRDCYMVKTLMQHPQPELAKFIESVCVEENWEAIFRKIFPNIKYFDTGVTGSMAHYIPILDYYSGSLPLVSMIYSSSECDLGFNLNPMCDPCDISYTIMPNMAYYEFIPLNSKDGDNYGTKPHLIDMANVEVGQEYELVVTTFSGLYRYRIGDVLCPTGFYNSTPQFKFVRRRSVVLTVDVDKTTESELHKAIEMASNVLRPYDTIILDYTSTVCRTTIPGHYVIYLELVTKSQAKGLRPNNLEECCLAMEESLGSPYRAGRVSHSIGPLEIRVVSTGTFDKLKDVAIARGASFMQFKMPRCVKLMDMLELLDSRVVSTHFSPKSPHYSP